MLPITYRSSEGPTSEIKVFQDPAPDFSAAKARGETVLILRNVPVGFAVRTLHSLLMTSSTEGVRWLGDLLFFHKLFDPYEESFLPQMLGIAVASPNDPLFEAIPAVIWVPGVQEPILVNVSSHSCAVCTSNHRTRDHSSFAAVRRNRIANPYLITMWQLQNCRSLHAPLPFTARIIGQHPAVASFKAEPGTFFIGTDLEVEVWSCALCSFCCGWALDSAMEHIASPAHQNAIQLASGNITPLEEYGDVKAHVFNQNGTIATFLAQG
ncbi:unnamed protein product [Closterium sp. NIES-65]|nr:unnamed protein product [Closterium sp. NIES-65]